LFSLQDHLYFSVIARTTPDASASQLYNRVDLLQAAQRQYASNHSGPLTTPVGPTYGFRQLGDDTLGQLGLAEILTNRTDQAHVEYLWENIYYPSQPSMVLPQYPPNKDESFMSLTAALLAPVSRGSVTLQSNTIQDAPLINLNYLESSADQQLALFMFRSLRDVLSHPLMSNFTVGADYGEVVPGANVTDDATILEYLKSTLLPVWHASGTCRMLPRSDGGVVDDRLKVYGVDGLRVVDASVFPIIPDQHVQGPTYMVAEKAADMIKEDYGLE
jgi:choline dehydrogenase